MGKRGSKLSPEAAEELAKTTHFSLKELNQWYKGFMKECPSGVVDEKEFCRIYRQFFPFGDPSSFAKLVFKTFDGDDKGNVGFKEFVRCLSITARGSTEERLQWSFRLYDLDRDGYISREEMITVVESIYKMVGQMVEFDEMNAPQERVKNIFDTMDQDGDGKIALEDFIECSKKDPTIIRSLSLFNGLC